MIINTNVPALNTYNKMSINNQKTSKHLEKLSSGLRINQAADDAAGLGISEKLRGQIRGLAQAGRNIQDGISLLRMMDGGMQEICDIMQRQRELLIQALNDTNTQYDRSVIQQEINQLSSAINDIADKTEFNTIKLLSDESRISGGYTIPGHWKDTWVPMPNPVKVYERYDSRADLISYRSVLLGSTFNSNPAIQPPINDRTMEQMAYFFDGTRTHSVSFNLERYIMDDDNASSVPIGAPDDYKNMNFADFVTADDGSGLFPINPSDPLEPGRVQYFLDRIASALAEAYTDALSKYAGLTFPSPGIQFAGTYNTNVSGEITGISFSITNPPNCYFDIPTCLMLGNNNFSHSFMHMSFSPAGEQWVPGNPDYGDWEKVWVDPVEITESKVGGRDLGLRIHNGANSDQIMFITLYDCRAISLGIDKIFTDPRDLTEASLLRLDAALETVNKFRANAGAQNNRLEHALANVVNSNENMSASESRIRDTDMFKEMTMFSQKQIQLQSSMEMLAEAQKLTELALKFLK